MQPYLQPLATIYATTNVNLKKSVENYIYFHNKLQLVANRENECPCGADAIINITILKATKTTN